MIVDRLTKRMQDYLRSPDLKFNVRTNYFVVDMRYMIITLNIKNGNITTNVEPLLSVACEPYFGKFNDLKIKLQKFVIDNNNEINEVIRELLNNQTKLTDLFS